MPQHDSYLPYATIHTRILEQDCREFTPLDDITYTFLSPDHKTLLTHLLEVCSDDVEERLHIQGRVALALSSDQTLVGHAWVAYETAYIPELHLDISLLKNHVYLWDCMTVPEKRGCGIFPSLLGYVLAQLYEEGVRQVWAAVLPGNAASLRAFAKAGFSVAAMIDAAGCLQPCVLPRDSVDYAAALECFRRRSLISE